MCYVRLQWRYKFQGKNHVAAKSIEHAKTCPKKNMAHSFHLTISIHDCRKLKTIHRIAALTATWHGHPPAYAKSTRINEKRVTREEIEASSIVFAQNLCQLYSKQQRVYLYHNRIPIIHNSLPTPVSPPSSQPRSHLQSFELRPHSPSMIQRTRPSDRSQDVIRNTLPKV